MVEGVGVIRSEDKCQKMYVNRCVSVGVMVCRDRFKKVNVC